MGKKVTETNKKVVNNEKLSKLKENIENIPNDITIENKPSENEEINSNIETVIKEVNDLKENSINPLLQKIENDVKENVDNVNTDDVKKQLDDVIKAAEDVEKKLVEEIKKVEPKIKNNYTNVWNGAYGYDIF